MNRDSANINVVPLGAMLRDPNGNPDDYRPYKLYQAINYYRHDQFQNYNGLQLLLNRQKGRYNFLSSYTFSKTLGIRGGAQGARDPVLFFAGCCDWAAAQCAFGIYREWFVTSHRKARKALYVRLSSLTPVPRGVKVSGSKA